MSFTTPNFTIGNVKGLLKLAFLQANAGLQRDADAWIQRLSSGSDTSSSSAALERRETTNSATTQSTTSGGSSSNEGGNSTSTSTTFAKPKDDNSMEAIVTDILLSTVASIVLYTLGVGLWTVSKALVQAIAGPSSDGESGDVDQINSSALERLHRLLKKRGRPQPKQPLRLNSHETHLAEDIIDPDDIDEGFADIGGMDHLKQEIWELAILPLLRPEMFQSKSKLLQQPSGILLYGKPGCGKTLLAKAIAKESAAVFIPIKLSKILNKWVGESNKLVAATFSLARKLAPSVIFLDEVHCFLSDSVDPSASKSMESLKAEFLTLWDGVSTNGSKHAPVLVLGATNHPHLIDQAILRRMPRTFAVPLPSAQGRKQILEVLLQDQPMDKSAVEFLPILAYKKTKNYSGSDLKELCRTAAREPIREVVAEEARRAVMGEKPKPKPPPDKEATVEQEEEQVRPVSRKDFEVALTKVKKTGQAAKEYGRQSASEEAMANAFGDNDPTVMLRQLLSQLGIGPAQLQQILNHHNGPNFPGGASGGSTGSITDDDSVPPPLPE